MLPFSTLIRIDRKAEIAVYQQIANQLVSLIRDGRIQPGAKLPGSRELAGLLQVHRKTIVAAYEELDAQDWIEIVPRKGISVSCHLPELKPKSFKGAARQPAYAGSATFALRQSVIMPDFPNADKEHRIIINDGFPDSRLAPMDLLLRLYKDLLNEKQYKRFSPRTGFAGTNAIREALSIFLNDTRGLLLQPSNIIVTRGGQMAIYLAAQLLIEKGDYIITSKPNYFIADKAFEQAGARILRVPADDNGIDVDGVEELCKRKPIRLLYIIPHHHHPTTVTLSMDRRMKLLDIIRRYNLIVIEDDYDYDFHYSSGPILPLASADHEGNILYLGSLSKATHPSIRLGYMVATPDVIARAASLRRIIDIRGDNLMEDAMAALISNGDLARHMKKSNKVYEARRDYICQLFTAHLDEYLQFRKPDGGLAIWTRFNADRSLPRIAALASPMGLLINDGNYYNDQKTNYNATRFGFASMQPEEMDLAVELLCKVCKSL